MRKVKLASLTLALLAASTSLAWSNEKPSRSRSATPASSNNLDGVWEVTRYGVNCATGQDLGSHFTALMTFHQDGTVLAQAYGPFPDNAFGGNEMGVWQHTPGNSFAFRNLTIGYDNNGHANGKEVISASGSLTSQNTFAYTATIEVRDLDGNPLFTLCGRATGTRFE
jgi:hypothetical protein